ncbi:hypothetical protein E2562_019893 [Oryza meyeriana var. granulata]|uniref:Uncharacterized protein n=1 Tax=Oryza meyeriana var. granulata TaxID=110450 RepID=A0A6G1EXD5_9ORYZ|nr:hypothetical protein E2562_019893 [Oryza meyeriana var. granulata]
MKNVLIDQSTGGFDDYFCRRTVGDGCRRLAAASPRRSIYGSFTYAPTPPFQYTPYETSLPSLPPLPSSSTKGKATAGRTTTTTPAEAAVVRGRMGDCKRKKPRTPRSADEPPRAQRRRPLERAAPLPPAPAVAAALDDLEREVTRGFVEDLLHALAPPPSSLPLPTFSLVRTAAAKAAASCAI